MRPLWDKAYSILDGLVIWCPDRLEVSVSSTPVEVCVLVGKGHELISSKPVSKPRS